MLSVCLIIPMVAAETPPALTFRASTLSLDQNLTFDEAGKPQSSHNLLNLQLIANGPAKLLVTGTRRFVISELVTDTGEAIQVLHTSPGDDFDEVDHRNDGNPDWRRSQGLFQMSLQARPPAGLGGSIKTLKGTLQVTIAQGFKRAKLKPIKDLIGKQVKIAGLKDVTVSIEEHTDKQIRLSYDNALNESLRSIDFENANGEKLECHGWNGGGGNGTIERTYHVVVPADGVVVVNVYHDVQTFTVPVALADLPLPGGPRSAKDSQVVVIEAKPVDAAKPELKKKTPTLPTTVVDEPQTVPNF
jgi:hypothetical protein